MREQDHGLQRSGSEPGLWVRHRNPNPGSAMWSRQDLHLLGCPVSFWCKGITAALHPLFTGLLCGFGKETAQKGAQCRAQHTVGAVAESCDFENTW